MSIEKTVAITGAGSGLGLDIAIGFAKKGYRVFGTVFNENEVDGFHESHKDLNIEFTVTDITNESSMANWGQYVTTQLSGKELDILVNNAGVLTPGPMEYLPIDAIRKEFEVNVFGSLSAINTFLPLLRINKGRIVQIGSMTARFSLPFSGPSSASKATMESFADVYRLEFKSFGVDFTMVQPGNMNTGGPAKTAAQLKYVKDTMSSELIELYGVPFDKFEKSLNAMQSAGISGTDAANQVISISEENPAPIRATLGDDAQELLQMVKVTSDADMDAFKEKLLGLSD